MKHQDLYKLFLISVSICLVFLFPPILVLIMVLYIQGNNENIPEKRLN